MAWGHVSTLAGAAALAACLLQPGAASAADVKLDFEGQAPAFGVAANLEISGFRLSPSCHYDLVDAQASYGSQWIGIDGSNCRAGGLINPQFLGPDEYIRTHVPDAPPVLWLDHAGQPFSLHSLDLVSADYTILSSKGGSARVRGGPGFVPPIPQTHFEFDAPEWTGVTWLVFILNNDFGAPQGFDNLALSVPEPGTRGLLAVALGCLALRHHLRRR